MCGALVAPGIYSERGVKAADILEGREVRIEGGRLRLPGGATCALGPPRSETLDDSMARFGYGGGSWSKVGLVPETGAQDYKVEIVDILCAGLLTDPLHLVSQADRGVLLLEVQGRAFVPLTRPASK